MYNVCRCRQLSDIIQYKCVDLSLLGLKHRISGCENDVATLLGDHHIEDPLYLYSFLLISLHATVLHSNQSSHPHTLSLFLSLPLSPPPLSLTLLPLLLSTQSPKNDRSQPCSHSFLRPTTSAYELIITLSLNCHMHNCVQYHITILNFTESHPPLRSNFTSTCTHAHTHTHAHSHTVLMG